MCDVAGLHRAIGGTAAWRGLAETFYSHVDRDPVLRPLFPGKTLHCAIEELTAFLAQLFEGPAGDTQRRWWLSLRESHLRFTIRRQERAAWMKNMVRALDDVRVDEPLRIPLREFFERASAYLVNSGEPVAMEPNLPDVPVDGDAIRREIAQCWAFQCSVDEAAAALRGGEADRAIAAAEGLRNRSVLAGLLAKMMAGRRIELLRYVQQRVTQDPSLVRERYAGRTLLHEASAQGNPAMVELLLRLDADPNAHDGGSHTPLYSLANQYGGWGAGDVVHALVRAGANVNANGGAKNCTALHMAARRGNREIAEALLACGADIEAGDSLGDTPLRRAVNCGRIEVASLLLARGADVHSVGNKGLTPLLAARTSAMKQLLRSDGR